MKKYITAVLCISVIFLACSKKSLPVITARTSNPGLSVAEKPEIIPDEARGKIIFTNRCQKCHGLPEPTLYTKKRWEGILSYMVPKARLSDEEAIHLTAYLKANAAK